jgi:hypothetical protein
MKGFTLLLVIMLMIAALKTKAQTATGEADIRVLDRAAL